MTASSVSVGYKAKRCPSTLIVDDSQDAAYTFALLLKTLGCDATAITDPLAALQTAETVQPDLIFLDLRMPGLSGLELARRLRAKYGWQRMRLVALTAFGGEEFRAATREAGFDAHLLKPVDIHLVESMLRTLLPEIECAATSAAR